MSRKAIPKVEEILSEENVVSFSKDKKTGYFRLTNQKVVRDQITNTIKSQQEEESDDFFRIADDTDYDFKFDYQDIDNTVKTIYFKRVVNEQPKEQL
tara:strand:+ start:1834 stop:2124 length:291 start_codon:yes stop_codon:yes gene_type:complete